MLYQEAQVFEERDGLDSRFVQFAVHRLDRNVKVHLKIVPIAVAKEMRLLAVLTDTLAVHQNKPGVVTLDKNRQKYLQTGGSY